MDLLPRLAEELFFYSCFGGAGTLRSTVFYKCGSYFIRQPPDRKTYTLSPFRPAPFTTCSGFALLTLTCRKTRFVWFSVNSPVLTFEPWGVLVSAGRIHLEECMTVPCLSGRVFLLPGLVTPLSCLSRSIGTHFKDH